MAADDTPQIARVTWTVVRVPFVRPFATAHGAMRHREGVLITFEAEGGLAGVGEATPWPAFGLGDVGDALRVIVTLAPRLVGRAAGRALDIFAGLDLAKPGVAAAHCAIDLAAYDLVGKARGVSVATLLGGARGQGEAGGVAVNATIGAIAPGAAAMTARAAITAGYDCLKVKVGAGPLAEDEARVAAVRDAAGPGVLIRLDANGAWGETEAITAIARLARYDLELIEQPVAADDLAALARVRRAVKVPLAADEAVRNLDDARRIAALAAADVLVIKPMVCGGLVAGRAILDLAAAVGLGAFVTTTIDFGPGIAGALALGQGSNLRHCGLATAGLLESTLVRDVPMAIGGRMAMPKGLGLGVTLDGALVERYGADGKLAPRITAPLG